MTMTRQQVNRWAAVGIAAAALAFGAVACSRSTTEVIYITATPLLDDHGNPIIPPSMTPDRPTNTPIQPTPNPTRERPQLSDGSAYIVQNGDTLGTIANQFGVSIEAILSANTLADPNVLEVGHDRVSREVLSKFVFDCRGILLIGCGVCCPGPSGM